MNPLLTALGVLVLILAGVFAGTALRKALPDEHLSPESKDVIRLGSGLVGTMAALVLSLLISSAKSSFDTQRNEIRQMTANIILLDRTLESYGAETKSIREDVRASIEPWIEIIWGDRRPEAGPNKSLELQGPSGRAYAGILQLAPQNDGQRFLKNQALQLVTTLVQTRFLIYEQADTAIPLPFLAVLAFWLTIIFASFSLFSDLNPTSITALCVFALSAAGAIFLIMEMDQPFSGFMQISSAPLRHALEPLTP
jgi:uncharacterized protein DUF4239